MNQDTVHKRNSETGDRWYKSVDLSMLLLLLYIFFLYTAQNTLLPPAIHSIVMYCFIGWVFLKAVVRSHGKIRLSYYSVWYLGMILLSFLSFTWGTHQVTSALYAMFVAFIISFCIIYTINSAEKLEICLRMYVIAADTMGIMLLLTGQIFGGTGERLGQNVTGNANSFSALLMVAAVFAEWFLIYKEIKIDKIFHLASLVWLLFLMAVSGGRKTILAVGACYIIFSFSKDVSHAWRMLFTLVKISVVIALMWVAITKIPFLYETIGERFEQLIAIFTGEKSSVHSDSVREQLIEIALERWTLRPILGYGVDTFKYYNVTVTGHFYYAHNNYAEILYDLGLVGFFIYYSFIANLLIRFLTRLKSPDGGACAALGIGLIVEMLVYDIGGISYYTVMTQVMLSISFVCLTCYAGTKKDNLEPSHNMDM